MQRSGIRECWQGLHPWDALRFTQATCCGYGLSFRASSVAQGLSRPLIETLPGSGGHHRHRLMDFRVKSQNELAREVLAWLDPVLGARIQEHAQGNFTLALKPFYIGGVEIRATVQAHEFTPEHLNIRVEGNDGLEALDSHHVNHGFTPFSSSHLRIAATAPLSVSCDGCGRWNTRTPPNKTPPRASLPVRQAQHPIPATAPQFPPNGYCPKLDGRRSDRACVGAYASWA